jgi:protein gp37
MKKPNQYWDITLNAFRGCSHISDGCKNCWAERFAVRHAANPKTKHLYEDLITNGKWNGKTKYFPEWTEKLPNKKRILFTAMGDMFHEENDNQDIITCLSIMTDSDNLFFVPTKRVEIAADFLENHNWDFTHNIILLMSASNQRDFDKQKTALYRCSDFVRTGLSLEPLLEKIDIGKLKCSWVSAGGETGQGARPCKAEWLEAIYSDCKKNRIPFFFKGGKNIDREIILPREEIAK